MDSTCDNISEDKTREIIGLWPIQYKILQILKEAPFALTEAQVRQRYQRKSSLHSELNALVELGLVSREKRDRLYFYSIKKEEE